MNLASMRSRVGRLRELARGVGQEVAWWQKEESPLLPGELREYLRGLYDVIAGADEAAVVLDRAVKRLVETFGPGGPTA
jgi:hypothetical protein